jgi:L-ascorbate metabolism protein UlaG (beta-lactamase superfamily)
MIDNIKSLGHSSIKIINNSKIIYIDPYNLKESNNDADIIFITHSHYDHFSINDINKIKKDNTIIIITEDIYNELLELGFKETNIKC